MIDMRWISRLRRRFVLRRLKQQSTGLLRELLELPPTQRGGRLDQRGVRDELALMGNEDGVAWLESALESPVMPQWGQALYGFNPTWQQLERWTLRSKEHCLAAIDALLLFGTSSDFDSSESARLPTGADAVAVNALMDEALARYDNPRLRMAAKQIRHIWPRGAAIRHAISIPGPIYDAAKTLFESNAVWMREWTDQMESAFEPPTTAAQIWYWLVMFCDHKELLVFCDWNSSAEDVAGRLRRTRAGRRVNIAWMRLERFQGENEELWSAIADELHGSPYSLIQLDTGGDDFSLAIIPSDSVKLFQIVAESCLNDVSAIRLC